MNGCGTSTVCCAKLFKKSKESAALSHPITASAALSLTRVFPFTPKMKEAGARLAQRLKNRLSVRRKKAARGRFNVKATLRTNMQYGGVPFHIELDRRKKTKPQVMMLWDISDP